MKRILLYLWFLPLCGISQSYNLTIIDGYGDGTYVNGDAVNIWSDPAGTNHVFSHWSGSGSVYLNYTNEWRAQLIIPVGVTANSFVLEANYEELDDVNFGQYTFLQWGEEEENGIFFPTEKIVDYAYGSDSKAIVFLIHGTGGNSGSWVDRYDRRTIIKDLVYAGYAVFALNSNETSLGDQNGDGKIRWQADALKLDTSTNVDFKNVLETRDLIFDELDVDNLPTFMIGGSNGANFSDFATAALDFKASCHMTGNGITGVFENHPNLKPSIWIQSKNDNNQSADSIKAQANFNQLVMQGITAEWHWLKRSPVHPFRFERSRINIDSDLSVALFDELVSKQLLDSNNYLTLLDINADFPFADFYSNFNLSNLQKRDFEDQLSVVNADHGANGDFNKTIIRFFDDCLLLNSSEDVENEINLSIAPNPAFNFIRIESKDNSRIGYSIYAMDGMLLRNDSRKSWQHYIDISDFKSGVFFIKTETTSGRVSVARFIKS